MPLSKQTAKQLPPLVDSHRHLVGCTAFVLEPSLQVPYVVGTTQHLLSAGPYRKTVNLPQTKFNMRANSKQREPELQKWWQKSQIYEKLSKGNKGEPFILHDGPPYANGDLHIGHALNKVKGMIKLHEKAMQLTICCITECSQQVSSQAESSR